MTELTVEELDELEKRQTAFGGARHVNVDEWNKLIAAARRGMSEKHGTFSDTDWQPISTAPKDEWVLVCGGNEDQHHWGPGVTVPPVMAAMMEQSAWGWRWLQSPYDSNSASIVYENPTHWMPLPSPPHNEGKDDDTSSLLRRPSTSDDPVVERPPQPSVKERLAKASSMDSYEMTVSDHRALYVQALRVIEQLENEEKRQSGERSYLQDEVIPALKDGWANDEKENEAIRQEAIAAQARIEELEKDNEAWYRKCSDVEFEWGKAHADLAKCREALKKIDWESQCDHAADIARAALGRE